MTLTNVSLVHGSTTDTLSQIEIAELTGGAGDNTIDASGFTGLGAETLLQYLGNQSGLSTVDGTDFSITLRDGTVVNINLSYAATIQDVLDLINEADTSGNLTASLNAAQTGIDLTDATVGAGDLTVAAVGGSLAATVLGIEKTGTGGSLSGAAIVSGHVKLDGGAGADTLTGGIGNDTFTGGAGNDTITGGAGEDWLVEVRDADMVLADITSDDATDPADLDNATLVIGSTETDTLDGVERADLSGGTSVNSLDASGFTLGGVILRTGGGVDSLVGSANDNDQFYIDITGLTAGTDKVSVNVGGGTENEIIVEGMDSSITQEDFEWVSFTGKDKATYTVNAGDTATIDGNISVDGMNIKIAAGTVKIKGYTIDASHATAAGDITIKGKEITIDEGAQLIALASTDVSSAVHGDITVLAESRLLPWTTGWYNYDNLKAKVFIGETAGTGNTQTTLKAGNVSVGAVVNSQNYLAASNSNNNNWFAENALSVAEAAIEFSEGLALLGAVSRAVSTAKIEIGEFAQITAEASPDTSQNTGNVTIVSSSLAQASAKPYSWGFAASVGIIENESRVNINGNVNAAGDVYIHADAKNAMDVEANPTKLSKMAGSVAVSVIQSTAEANVKDGSVMTVGGNLNVSSNTSEINTTVARSIAGVKGKLGIAIAIAVDESHTNAYLDGTVTVAGDITVDASMDDHILDDNGADSGIGANNSLGRSLIT